MERNTNFLYVKQSSHIILETEIPVGRNITGWPDVFVKTNVLFVPCSKSNVKSTHKSKYSLNQPCQTVNGPHLVFLVSWF